jgi:hypothetical protein
MSVYCVCKVKFIFECVLVFSILKSVKHDATISVAFYIMPCEINVQNKNTLWSIVCVFQQFHLLYLFITFLPFHQCYSQDYQCVTVQH